MLHTANEETSNWMRFVQRAPASAQQNVVAFQQGGDIYFITRCDVAPGAELLHWFSRDTAAFMGTFCHFLLVLHTPTAKV